MVVFTAIGLIVSGAFTLVFLYAAYESLTSRVTFRDSLQRMMQ